MESKNPERNIGVMVGRFCPMHISHEKVISHMIDACGVENSLIVVGSQNTPMSMRHFFSYSERSFLIKKVFPEATVVGLPDFDTDKEWILALNDLTEAIHGTNDQKSVTYFGGSREDVSFFEESGRNVHILNRYDGTTPKTSASEVRDRLIEGKIRGTDLINENIEEFVIDLFQKKWELFKNR